VQQHDDRPVAAAGMVATRPYVMASLVRLLFGKAFADQRAADEVITASGLDWTIVRATRLVASAAPDTSPRLSTEHFAKGPWSLSHAAYASELLDLAQAGTYVRDTVNTTG
jgi:hypothetical protein